MGTLGFTTIDHAAAEQLIADGVTVIDVRTPREYEQLGHIPGALLIPVDLIASAPAVLPPDTPRRNEFYVDIRRAALQSSEARLRLTS